MADWFSFRGSEDSFTRTPFLSLSKFVTVYHSSLHTVRCHCHNVKNLMEAEMETVRVHQASASRQSQCCDDATDIAFIEINGVAPKWVATPSWSDLISMSAVSQASSQH